MKCLPPWKENLSVEQNLLGKLRKDHTDTREDCFPAKDPLLKLYQPVYLHQKTDLLGGTLFYLVEVHQYLINK